MSEKKVVYGAACGKGPNEHYTDNDGIVHIKLTLRQETLVSSEDYPKVAPFRWYAARRDVKHRKQFYARTKFRKSDGNRSSLLMHTLIFEPGPGLEVDHIFGDGLDNRRGRTRNVTKRVNCRNLHHTRTSQYPGVSWHKQNRKWVAYIWFSGKLRHLGSFDNELDAAAAYRDACDSLGV